MAHCDEDGEIPNGGTIYCQLRDICRKFAKEGEYAAKVLQALEASDEEPEEAEAEFTDTDNSDGESDEEFEPVKVVPSRRSGVVW